MRRFHKLLALAVVAGPAALSGCTSDAPASPQGPPSVNDQTDDVGSVSLALQLAGGTTVDSFQYIVTNANGFRRTATIDLTQSATLSTLIGGLPAASGYVITISTVIGDGGTNCAGSATFDVTARAVASVLVRIACHEQPRQGSAFINGALNFCPVLDSLGANVAEVLVGGKSLSAPRPTTPISVRPPSRTSGKRRPVN